MNRGYTLIELLVVVATIGILMSVMIPMMQSAMLRAHVGAAAAEARIVHMAFKRHFVDENVYPNAVSDPAFDLSTFEPLVQLGYYDGAMASKLLGEAADGYDSPDDSGGNQEFWLEMTLRFDDSIRFLVADSNNAPLGGGEYLDGIYMYREGVLTPLTSPVTRN